MKKHIKARRTQYKSHLRRTKHTLDTCDTRNTTSRRIHIPIRYDGYAQTEYVKVIYGKTRDTRTRTHIGVTNTINEIFPEINAPHTAKTYRGTAPYRKYIPQQTNYTPPENMMDEYKQTITRTERIKCIIYSNDKMIHAGIFTRTIDINGKDITITLHRADRSIQVKPYIPMTDTIHGVKIREIYAHNVEIYKI